MTKIIAAFLAFVQSVLLLLGLGSGSGGKWKLNMPVYDGGVICETVYDTGSGLLSDSEGATESNGKMQLVSATKVAEYETYCD